MTIYKTNDNGVDRDMTDKESELHEMTLALAAKIDADKIEKELADASAKASARAKLKVLGLTDAEIAALVG